MKYFKIIDIKRKQQTRWLCDSESEKVRLMELLKQFPQYQAREITPEEYQKEKTNR